MNRAIWTNHSSTRTVRSAVAMLIVLAVLVIGLAAATTIARLTVTSALTDQANGHDLLLHAMSDAAHERVIDWLESESQAVVLPPDIVAPALQIAGDSWKLNDLKYQVTIIAFDQAGMVPWEWLDGNPPFPRVVLDRLESISVSDSLPGLDLLITDGQPSPYPSSTESHAIGSKLATHSHGIINIATAPNWLLEHLESRENITMPDSVRASRSVGELPETSSIVRSEDSAIRLVSRSGVWAFRIDLRIGLVAQSLWVVYEKTRRGWERRQRLAII